MVLFSRGRLSSIIAALAATGIAAIRRFNFVQDGLLSIRYAGPTLAGCSYSHSGATMPNLTPHLFVEDLQRSIAFYRDVMRFEVTRAEPADNPTFASLKRGESTLMLSPFGESFEGWKMAEEADKRRGAGGPVSFYIEAVEPLADEYARAQAAGAAIVDPLSARPWGQTEFTMSDPDGFWWAVWTA